jgi:tetratricopeptide (TPR) repeat protein
VSIRRWLSMVTLFVVLAAVFGIRTYSIVRQVVFDRIDRQAYERALDQNARVPAGFLVQNVPVLSKANRVGLHPGDIITNYNGTAVTNVASYRAAVDGNLADKARSVTLTVYRDGSPLQMSAPPGLLGFDGKDWSPLSDTVVKMILAGRADQAKALLAGSDKSVIPPEDLLIAQLLLMGERDPGEDQLLRQLMTHLVSFDDVAEKFLDVDQYKTAQTLLLKAVEVDPENTSTKINLALAYDWADQFDDADRVIQDVLAHQVKDLTDYGWYCLLKARGEINASRKNYVAAVADLQKAIELAPFAEDTRVRLRYLFALAKLGDAQQFERGLALCEKHSIPEFANQRHKVDALRAYVLSRNGADAEAKATVEKWRNNANGRKWVVEYWSAVPNGADIVETWNRLLK